MSSSIDISSTLSRRDTTYTVALDDDDNFDKGLHCEPVFFSYFITFLIIWLQDLMVTVQLKMTIMAMVMGTDMTQ